MFICRKIENCDKNILKLFLNSKILLEFYNIYDTCTYAYVPVCVSMYIRIPKRKTK
jgi:hypothetical protein